jgi:KDO2-lipid IV(A) lauroyltransferase
MRFLLGLIGKIFAGVITFSPPSVRDAIGDCVGFLWFDIFRIRRKIAIDNVSIAFPELPLGRRKDIARKSLRNMGRTIVEFGLFPFLKKETLDEIFVFEGLEHVDRALDEKKGLLLLGLHLGNGDLSIAAVSLRGYKMNLISKRFKSKWLDDLWFGMRGRHGTKFISPEKSSFDILRALGRNEIVIFVLDQFMGPPVGVRTQFFGRQTGTAMGLGLVQLRTGAPVIPTYTYRRADRKTVIVFEEQLERADFGLNPESADRRIIISMLTQKYTDKIEEIVRRFPEQWMWIHRRWKDFVE